MARKSHNQKQNAEAQRSASDVQTAETAETVDPRTLKLGHKVEMVVERENGETETKRYASKSQAIVDLYVSHGMDTGEIAKALGIRYQFAYNVLKRNGKLGNAPTRAGNK